MKELFPGYYRPTTKELTQLWDTCIFMLDASVLLNLYRYTPETSSELLSILKGVPDRLWVPHQAALEYHRNRHIVIAQQREAYAEIKEFLTKSFNQLEAKFNSYQRHPYIDTRHLLQRIQTAFSRIGKELDARYREHPDLIEDDTLKEKITTLFTGKVGAAYPPAKLSEIFKEGEDRYKHNIPPGYMDASTKDDDNKYGDLIIWFQILDKAKETQQPVVFVTDDAKEDWWWKFKGRTLAPRPELVEEIVVKANVSFHMYRSDQFMEYAREYLKRKVAQQAIDEVRMLRKQDEEMRMLQAQLQMKLKHSEHEQQKIQEELYYVERQLADLQRETDDKSVRIIESASPGTRENDKDLMKLRYMQDEMRERRARLQMQLERLTMEIAHLSQQQHDIRHRIQRIESQSSQ